MPLRALRGPAKAVPGAVALGVAPGAAPGRPSFTAIMVAGFVFSAAINLLLLCVPLYSLQIFSRAIPTGNVDTLVMLTIIVVLALTIMALLEMVRTRLFNRAANALEVIYRRRMVADTLEAGNRGPRDGLPQTDLADVRGFLKSPTFAALADLPWTPLYLVVIYLIHPLLAGMMVLAALVLVSLGWIGQMVAKGPTEPMRTTGGRAGRLFEAMQSRGDTIRALRMQPAILDRWHRENMAVNAMAGEVIEKSAGLTSATKWVRYLLQIATTGVGAALVIDNHLSMGGMIATSMLVGRAMAPIEAIAGGWTPSVKALQAWRRLKPYLNHLDATPAKPANQGRAGRLTVENLVFVTPREQRPVIRGISFVVEPGEMLCLVGPNRAGKSMLARLLTGAALPTAGHIRLDGVPVNQWQPADPRAGIGYLPPHSDLLPGTIAENIARYQPDAMEAVIAAARRVGIHELIENLPQAYDTDIADAGFTGGTERLVALARAVFGQPALLVLDEPSSGLDLTGIERVRGFLDDMRQTGVATVVLSSTGHFADLADRTLVLSAGIISQIGPRETPTPEIGRPDSARPGDAGPREGKPREAIAAGQSRRLRNLAGSPGAS